RADRGTRGGGARLDGEDEVRRRRRGDVERGRGRAGQAPIGGRQSVAGARLVDGEVREGGDATDGRHGGGAAERPAAGVGADRHGHVRRVGGHHVAEGVLHRHLHRRVDRRTRDGRTRLDGEHEVVGRRRGDVERGGG